MAAETGTMPKALVERPDLWPHLQFYSAAFSQITTERPLGAMGGCGAVPWSSIDRYAARYGIEDLDAFERFERLIRAQDRVYLEDVAAKAKAKSGKT